MASYLHTGVEDYRHPLDLPLVEYCFSTLARRPNDFYPNETADSILQRDFNITQGCISAENAEQLYLHLLQVITALM